MTIPVGDIEVPTVSVVPHVHHCASDGNAAMWSMLVVIFLLSFMVGWLVTGGGRHR